MRLEMSALWRGVSSLTLLVPLGGDVGEPHFADE